MTSKEIRAAFFQFFKNKSHQWVPSAPIVVKDDPTLMFTNAGMNQFKAYFLGNQKPEYSRLVNSQKCLRVSGKHNDLEEVGVDTYHHTMFEMLGNWSFGDFFKAEMIPWAWEFLTDCLALDQERLYVTIFEGDASDNLTEDRDAYAEWAKIIPKDRILKAGKKDNFWEMGEAGPCGPCSEIHIDLRSDKERKELDGKTLVNQDHPQVVEIWNLVFIEYNRLKDKSLQALPSKHVDTGMGLERLCMAIQGVRSNYDTDIFKTSLLFLEKLSGKKYTASSGNKDVAFRVIVDHIRAISFSIADGQLPSNNGAGYVIRRILRRAVRYGYSFLDLKQPFLYQLLPSLIESLGEAFPELQKEKDLIEKVIRQEELAFLVTLEKGIQRFQAYRKEGNKIVSGDFTFELYDTFGFPPDLTALLAQEENLKIDISGFEKNLSRQRSRSKADSEIETGDWVVVNEGEEGSFIGYDHTHARLKVMRYRQIEKKGKKQYHLVFDQTPFYPEGGGQLGDRGYIQADEQEKKYFILNTFKENNLILHATTELPELPDSVFDAVVDVEKRKLATAHHSATHLLHYSLRKILGEHVQQKGSLVSPDYLRFDFSHYQKPDAESLREVEIMVNEMIRKNIPREEERAISKKEAEEKGALALFGEKYGDQVRMISFGDSVELCGGTHVNRSGEIGLFKITGESAVAAGIRRVEAVCSEVAQNMMFEQYDLIDQFKLKLKQPKQLLPALDQLLKENQQMQKELEQWKQKETANVERELREKVRACKDFNVLIAAVKLDAKSMKSLVFRLEKEIESLIVVLVSKQVGKAIITIAINKGLVKAKGWNAAEMVKKLAEPIQGGGGGQAFFATAGGTKTEGVQTALKLAEEMICP